MYFYSMYHGVNVHHSQPLPASNYRWLESKGCETAWTTAKQKAGQDQGISRHTTSSTVQFNGLPL